MRAACRRLAGMNIALPPRAATREGPHPARRGCSRAPPGDALPLPPSAQGAPVEALPIPRPSAPRFKARRPSEDGAHSSAPTSATFDNADASPCGGAGRAGRLRGRRPPACAIAHDLHPDFHSTWQTPARSRRVWRCRRAAQHHHAQCRRGFAEHGCFDAPPGAGRSTASASAAMARSGRRKCGWPAASSSARHLRPAAPARWRPAARLFPPCMAAALLHASGRGDEIARRFWQAALLARVFGFARRRARRVPASPPPPPVCSAQRGHTTSRGGDRARKRPASGIGRAGGDSWRDWRICDVGAEAVRTAGDGARHRGRWAAGSVPCRIDRAYPTPVQPPGGTLELIFHPCRCASPDEPEPARARHASATRRRRSPGSRRHGSTGCATVALSPQPLTPPARRRAPRRPPARLRCSARTGLSGVTPSSRSAQSTRLGAPACCKPSED